MSMSLAYGLNYLLIVTECVIVYLAVSAFLKSRLRAWKTALSLLALSAAYTLVSLLLSGEKLIQLPLDWLATFVWVRLTFRADWGRCLIAALASAALVLISDLPLTVLYALLSGTAIETLMNDPYGYYQSGFLAKIVLLAPVAVVRGVRGRREALEALDWQSCVRAAAIPAILSVVSIALFRAYLDTPGYAPQLLVSTLLLAAADVATILLLAQMERQARELRDYAILRHAAQVTRDSVSAWKNAYDEQRRLSHEHQDQLRVVRGLMDTAPEEARQYLDRLLCMGPAPLVVSGTGRPFADVLLSQKTAAARQRGVTLRAEPGDLTDFPVPDDALVVLLSNLLDNAVEAAARVPEEGRRTVLLRITVTPEESFLYIENPTAGPVQIEGGTIRTTKRDARAHGYGLKNVAEVIERSGGEYAMDYDETAAVFRFSARFETAGV